MQLNGADEAGQAILGYWHDIGVKGFFCCCLFVIVLISDTVFIDGLWSIYYLFGVEGLFSTISSKNGLRLVVSFPRDVSKCSS